MKKPKKPLFVKDEDGNVPSSDRDKADIIKKHFQNALAPEHMRGEIKNYPPMKLKTPISSTEVTKAVKSMKNGKSCGEDCIYVEMIKYSPPEIHQKIADILNNLDEDTPEEVIRGILSALPKPGKPKGPPANLRPIILLSVLRKILTIIMLKRTWSRLAQRIPIDQAAYQEGRSTTEQVFSVKVLCEKAMAAQNIQLDIKMNDMSKAFDTISRKLLFTHLEEDLEPDEIYYLSILTNRPELIVRVGQAKTDPFTTLAGIMQGDCLSAVLFIYYLSFALKCTSVKIQAHEEGIFYIEPKYADDITSVTLNDSGNIMKSVDDQYPKALAEYHLQCNPTKVENHSVPPKTTVLPPSPDKTEGLIWSDLDWTIKPVKIEDKPTWKSCKLLGSRLDSETDIRCRKARACQVMNDISAKFKSKHLSIKTKINEFRTYVTTIFMYNSELWALNQTNNKKIDAFHRRLLRQAINRRWPKAQYTNDELYKITEEKPWSEIIKQRRLRWTGHLMRLNKNTPARLALHQYTETTQKNRIGRPKQTWLATIKSDLNHLNLPKDDKQFINEIEKLAGDRVVWRDIIRECGTVRKN